MTGNNSQQTGGLTEDQRHVLILLKDAYPATISRRRLTKVLGISGDALRQHIYRMRLKGVKIKMVHHVSYGLDDE